MTCRWTIVCPLLDNRPWGSYRVEYRIIEWVNNVTLLHPAWGRGSTVGDIDKTRQESVVAEEFCKCMPAMCIRPKPFHASEQSRGPALQPSVNEAERIISGERKVAGIKSAESNQPGQLREDRKNTERWRWLWEIEHIRERKWLTRGRWKRFVDVRKLQHR